MTGIGCAVAWGSAGLAVEPEAVAYNKQVRPILAEHCFKCHGGDEKARKGKLRLDVREAALEKKAVVPGHPESSELVKRIFTSDEEDVMPPVKEHKDLSPGEKDILRRWIAAGAEYQKHWAFIPPVKPEVPNVSSPKSEAGNEIDAFVMRRLEEEKLSPSPPTSKERWLRRVTLDLTGLPPTLRELDEFLADTSGHAYDAVVDRLLVRKTYGERMATDWLDAARYADTYGRHEDAESAVWRYRDWVVQAFNQNLPYDKFLTWQTAGDLLPNPTREQYIATVFNRLVQQSNEAGSNEEEFRQDHVHDRVKTNATAILGLTMECARCHDHKYDPFTQRDYYSFSAFLNNIDELGLFARQTAGIPAPSLLLYTPEQETEHRAVLEQMAKTEKELAAIREGAKDRFRAWCLAHGMPSTAAPSAHYDFESVTQKKAYLKKNLVDSVHPEAPPATSRQTPKPVVRGSGAGILFENDNVVEFPETLGAYRRGNAFSFAFWFQPTLAQSRAVLLHRTRGGLDAASRGYEIILNHGHMEFALSHFAPGNSIRIRTKQPLPLKEWTHVTAAYDGSSRAGGLSICLNGKPADCEVVRDNLYRDILYRKEWGDFDDSKIQDNGTPVIKLSLGGRYNDMGVKGGAFDELKVFDCALTPAEAAVLAGGEAPRIEQGWWDWLLGNKKMPANSEAWLDAWLRDTDETWRTAHARLQELRLQEDNLVNDVDEVMVMREITQRRPTFVLNRGQFDQPGAEVTPDTPAALPPFPEGAPRNRLGLAQWLVDRNNPLTARVAVNRIWQLFFGRGLVATPEDFGVQGREPSHPELLDWLACDFMDHGWDVKRLCRMIALSTTYRQSSTPADPALLERDPQNVLLARGPRHRLSAEQIRDSALAVSGLLVSELGGVPVKPYLPEHLYEDSGIQSHYEQDHGDKLWRRSLYTFRKRTMPPVNLLVFDSPTREFCRVRRECTNTPLQALTLMNDPQFVESCRVLAERLLREHPQDAEAWIVESFRLWTSRAPKPEEAAVLRRLLDDERAWFASHLEEAEKLRSQNGEAPADKNLNAIDVAAVTQLERVLLGDDETLVEQ